MNYSKLTAHLKNLSGIKGYSDTELKVALCALIDLHKAGLIQEVASVQPNPNPDFLSDMRADLHHILNCFTTEKRIPESTEPLTGQISASTFNRARKLIEASLLLESPEEPAKSFQPLQADRNQ